MKTLLLIRHAEAEWGDIGQADIRRSLTERGRQQAKQTAQHICKKNLNPNMIFSSTAKRAAMTTHLLVSTIDNPTPQIQWSDNLYLAESELLFSMAKQADNAIQTLAIVAHNPGLSELTNQLLQQAKHDMSPASVAAISWPVQQWQDISLGSATECAYLSPSI